MITQEELTKTVHYDPNSGHFRWLVTLCRFAKAGTRAGTDIIQPRYYGSYKIRAITINRRRYLEHRLAFLYMTGEMPKEVDHKNGDSTDNRWTNLRPCTRAQNSANQSNSKRTQSGIRGIYIHKGKKGDSWRVVIGRQHFGSFKNLEEAKQVQAAKLKEIFGEFGEIR